MRYYLGFMLVLFTMCEASDQEWYNNFLFQNKSFSLQFARHIGYATAKAADIGECVSVAKKIVDGDIESWTTQWLALADRMYDVARKFEKEKHLISAGETFMRAANYYLAAEFYLVEKEDRKKRLKIWDKVQESFTKALRFLYPKNSIQRLKIPYEHTRIPAYFCKAKGVKKDAPLLIVHSGFDGTSMELFWSVGLAAVERGYNCLIFEGPGQGEMILKQNVPFRLDWESPIKAVVDFAEKLSGVDTKKIALMGISFGGYLAPRAVAFEKRIKACIPNGGVIDFSTPFSKYPQEMNPLIEHAPQKFNEILLQAIESKVEAKWAFKNAMWRFGKDTPADLMKHIQGYNLKEVVKNITCPMLVVDSDDESFFPGQSKLLYDMLSGSKKLLSFTREDAAQAHCQFGATLLSSAKIFNWLDKTLKHKRNSYV